jgi:E3 ubiquitin-protein ligase MGRN1
MFFAKENEDCNITATKEGLLNPVTVSFQQGLGQQFRQPSGTGIDLLKFEGTELMKDGDIEVYPLVVKAEAYPLTQTESEGNPVRNSQITLALFEKKEIGEYHVRVIKQILWVNGMRYELQEIYGIGNTVDGDLDENDSGKECVICLSEPRDTTVLPCRHMVCSFFVLFFSLFAFLFPLVVWMKRVRSCPRLHCRYEADQNLYPF